MTIVDEFQLDAYAIRCWMEMQNQLGISPCVLLGELNDRGIAGACEVDIGNAVVMHAFELASDAAVTCLDWNNNYDDEDDKCILFHCGPAPKSMMEEGGRVTDHLIIGAGCGFGCNVGRIKPTDFTFGSLMTSTASRASTWARGASPPIRSRRTSSAWRAWRR